MNTIKHLEVKQLDCIRQGKYLFSNLSFSLQSGAALLIAGPNGAGKSSLLRLLAGIAAPAEGTIYWDGKSAQDTSYHEHLHYVGHAHGIRLGLTPHENLLLAATLAQHRITRMDETFALLKLSAQQHTPAQFLSAGQKRRVSLARLLLIPRTLWILDEPLTALDAATQHIMLQKIEEHLAAGGMCIMTSHQPLTLNIPVQQLELTAC
jgi:heme exporter protein A